MRTLVHLAAPGLTLIGVLISAVGTYLMSQVYHRHEKAAFWISLFKVVGYALRFRLADAREAVSFSARLVPDDEVKKKLTSKPPNESRMKLTTKTRNQC